MFQVGGGEVLVILLVALIVLGPDKLPGAVRKVGQVVSEVRKVSAGFQAEMRTAMLDDDANRRIAARDPEPTPPPAPDAAPQAGPHAGPPAGPTGPTDPPAAPPTPDDPYRAALDTDHPE